MKAKSSVAPALPSQRRWNRFAERSLLNLTIGLMVTTLTLAVLYPYMVITVPSGHVGVLWKRVGGIGIYCWCVVPRGTVLEPGELREEGLHIIWPWDLLFMYDLRLQTMTRSYNAISQDGVSLSASISVRYQLQHDSVAQLHKFIGPEYQDSLVGPVIGSRAREEIAKHSAQEVYSDKRAEIQEAIQTNAQRNLDEQLNHLVQPQSSEQLQKDGENISILNRPTKVALALNGAIKILDTPVLGIELPPAVVASINRKIEQYYVAQEYMYRVSREELESQRKAIEARGIRDFQQTVSQGISESYLRWRGIEATLQLAQSNNAKIVIVGGGKDGLPIILGNVDGPVQPSAANADTSDDKNRMNRSSLPLEKTPAPGLPTPGQKPPEGAVAPPAPPGQAPPPPPEKPQTFVPRSLSEIPSMFFGFPGNGRSTGSEAKGTPPTPP
jgi:regulator of protease activity HflC (stomatin/prohibitin superfamily)